VLVKKNFIRNLFRSEGIPAKRKRTGSLKKFPGGGCGRGKGVAQGTWDLPRRQDEHPKEENVYL